jgi:amidase
VHHHANRDLTFHPPAADQLRELAQELGIPVSREEIDSYRHLFEGLTPSYSRLAELAEAVRPVRYPRDGGRAPTASENRYGAWAWRCEITGAGHGTLSGIGVGVKDNICVAGLPMRSGSRALDGFTPESDATVVERILEAGGHILGKTVCEDLCLSGGSHTSQPAPVRNPRNPLHSAGGSSSGSAAAIVAGDVVMCLGGDQGGSIRTPSAWCGCVGLKPTHGLVPYTGIFSLETSLDHCGPMGRSVEDVARLLSVIAGPDGMDPRQVAAAGAPADYLTALSGSARGLRIAAVREGFGRPESEEVTDDRVRRTLTELADAGAKVEIVSIPWHLDAYHIYTSIVLEGAAEITFKGDAMGYGWQGERSRDLITFWGDSWRHRPDRLPTIAKYVLVAAEHIRRTYGVAFYAKAQNLRREMRAAYDAALSEYDVLAMPTIPFRAPLLPDANCGVEETIRTALNMEGNTGPFDASGHPAISVPCGMEGGLPVGLMFIGRHFDEAAVLRAASAVERLEL